MRNHTSHFGALASAAVLAIGALSPVCAGATEVGVVGVPTAWRVENYVPDSVVVWFTGATCAPNGGLSLPTNSVTADRERLFATIMYGKAAGKQVFIYYDPSTCLIVSFGVLEGG